MSSYLAQAPSGVSTIGVRAGGTSQLKLIRFEIFANAAQAVTFSKYSGATISGGSALTPFALRAGASASSATARSGGSISGTQNILSTQNVAASGSGSYAPQSDFIISPGDAFWMSWTTTGIFSVGIYFEELHLARSL